MPTDKDDQRHDRAVEDSFPASDPPASTGITGPGARRATRRAPHESRPKGTPTLERHATETAHHREHEDPAARLTQRLAGASQTSQRWRTLPRFDLRRPRSDQTHFPEA
jgi:hypothetical protein